MEEFEKMREEKLLVNYRKYHEDFKSAYGYYTISPIIKVKINDVVIPAILDSGNDYVFVPPKIVKQLNLNITTKDKKLVTGGGSVSCDWGNIDNFSIEETDINFKNVSFNTSEHCFVVLVGIMPLFKSYKVTIDVENQQIKFE